MTPIIPDCLLLDSEMQSVINFVLAARSSLPWT